MRTSLLFGLLLVLGASPTLWAAPSDGDWARFRGPNGSGVSGDAEALPTRWSGTENVKWKVALPGPGLSSPIIVGKRVFVTCWSGYGVGDDIGEEKDLRRHLVCLDRLNGKEIWSKSLEPVLPEDEYRGMFTQNGYASHTPTSDGENVYAFFGKTGLVAFDLDGKKLWQSSVGTGSGMRGWGSASSPILYKNLVIVTASAESEAVVALDKKTGKEVWNQKAEGFVGTWGTPILVKVDDNRQDLVLGVPYEVWGLNPDNGKLRWFADGIDDETTCASVVAHDGVVYGLGGRGGGSFAVRAGGKGDVNKTHVVWRGNDQARVGTPVVHGGRLYGINGGVANGFDLKTGKRVQQLRLQRSESKEEVAGNDEPPRERGERRRGGRRGGRGGRGRGGSDYSSPVVAGDKLYYFSRSGGAHVLQLGSEVKQVGHNRFGPSGEEFSASPAISRGELFIRSSTTLYCIALLSTVQSTTFGERVPLASRQPVK